MALVGKKCEILPSSGLLYASMRLLVRKDLDTMPLVNRRFNSMIGYRFDDAGNAVDNFPQCRMVEKLEIRDSLCASQPYDVTISGEVAESHPRIPKSLEEMAEKEGYAESFFIFPSLLNLFYSWLDATTAENQAAYPDGWWSCTLSRNAFTAFQRSTPNLRTRKTMLVHYPRIDNEVFRHRASDFSSLWNGCELHVCPLSTGGWDFPASTALLGNCSSLTIHSDPERDEHSYMVWMIHEPPLGQPDSGTTRCPSITIDTLCYNGLSIDHIASYLFSGTGGSSRGQSRCLNIERVQYHDSNSRANTPAALRRLIEQHLESIVNSELLPTFSLRMMCDYPHGEEKGLDEELQLEGEFELIAATASKAINQPHCIFSCKRIPCEEAERIIFSIQAECE